MLAQHGRHLLSGSDFILCKFVAGAEKSLGFNCAHALALNKYGLSLWVFAQLMEQRRQRTEQLEQIKDEGTQRMRRSAELYCGADLPVLFDHIITLATASGRRVVQVTKVIQHTHVRLFAGKVRSESVWYKIFSPGF